MTDLPRATEQDGSYPRPQLVRRDHVDLTGRWRFAIGRRGDEGECHRVAFQQEISVPYPPESPASGVGHTGYLPVVWYSRRISTDDVRRLVNGDDRVILHFGAVDYVADVWLGGQYLGRHEGGQTPFQFDVTDALGEGDRDLVVRAQDEPWDTRQPRGKQDWRDRPHSIWYERSTGIWQPVWLEAVPPVRIDAVHWAVDIAEAFVELGVEVAGWAPGIDSELHVQLWAGDVLLAQTSQRILAPEQRVRIAVPALADGQQARALLWNPEAPRLVDACLMLETAGVRDEVASYLGLREVRVEGREFLLNDRPYYLRSVLHQGYWPDTHLSASPAKLRTEAELIKALGFNAVRIHQKVEDPRFLYWCDRLGIAVWGEVGSAYTFSPVAVQRLTHEWMNVVRRDRSHPCIVAWVPLNESWGVQHGARRRRERDYGRALASLTRALDGTRPVISNDGWEHTDSDIITIHDYAGTGEVLNDRFADEAALAESVARRRSSGRRIWLDGETPTDRPVMLTEFGGIRLGGEPADGWGYSSAMSTEEYQARLEELVGAVRRSRVLSGYCYTQLTDTGQEVNGLLRADRSAKLPVETYRAIFGA